MFANYTFIDLDGVILDSEERVVEMKAKNEEISWNQFFQELDWFKLFEDSKSINDSVEIIRELERLQKKIAILTKIHALKEMEAKVNDLRNNRKINSPILFTLPHILKSQIYIPTNNEILIDDSIKNVNSWDDSGGNGILFDPYDKTTTKNKVKTLEFLLKR